MKRAYSPKDIAAKKWVTLPWGEKWNKPFGFPAENASWFISGASASGKSSFVMQLGKELCKYGLVLYLSYEEGVNQTFQRRMEYLKMNEVQGKKESFKRVIICDMEKDKVYISGAIAHYNIDERKGAFANAEQNLRNMGFSPVNPFKNGLPDEAHWREHMRADIALLLDCEYIYMLKDWELSKGAKLELDVASSCGIKVLFE